MVFHVQTEWKWQILRLHHLLVDMLPSVFSAGLYQQVCRPPWPAWSRTSRLLTRPPLSPTPPGIYLAWYGNTWQPLRLHRKNKENVGTEGDEGIMSSCVSSSGSGHKHWRGVSDWTFCSSLDYNYGSLKWTFWRQQSILPLLSSSWTHEPDFCISRDVLLKRHAA